MIICVLTLSAILLVILALYIPFFSYSPSENSTSLMFPPSLLSLRPEPRIVKRPWKGVSATSPQQKIIQKFYGTDWESINNLVPDRLHSHIGGESASCKYLQLLRLQRTDRFLDVGCGYGGLAILAAKQVGCSVTGVELLEQRVLAAIAASESAGVSSRVAFHNYSFEDWNAQGVPYDAAAALDMLVHIHDKPNFLEKLFSIVNSNGRILIADYFTEIPNHSFQFSHPAVAGPLPLKVFETALGKSKRAITFGEDLTAMALAETEALSRVLSPLKSDCDNFATNSLHEWEQHLRERIIQYRLFLVS